MRLALAAAALALAAGASAAQQPLSYYDARSQPKQRLPYKVTAPRGATYSLACRFRAIRIQGAYGIDRGYVNNINLSSPQPRAGLLPSDNARCTLRQTGKKGPITLTVVKAGRRYAAITRRKSETARLVVQ